MDYHPHSSTPITLPHSSTTNQCDHATYHFIKINIYGSILSFWNLLPMIKLNIFESCLVSKLVTT
jgi:hypothetical protein